MRLVDHFYNGHGYSRATVFCVLPSLHGVNSAMCGKWSPQGAEGGLRTGECGAKQIAFLCLSAKCGATQHPLLSFLMMFSTTVKFWMGQFLFAKSLYKN